MSRWPGRRRRAAAVPVECPAWCTRRHERAGSGWLTVRRELVVHESEDFGPAPGLHVVLTQPQVHPAAGVVADPPALQVFGDVAVSAPADVAALSRTLQRAAVLLGLAVAVAEAGR